MKHRYKWDWNALHLLKPQFSPQSKLSEQGAIKRLFVTKRARAANVRWENWISYSIFSMEELG